MLFLSLAKQFGRNSGGSLYQREGEGDNGIDSGVESRALFLLEPSTPTHG